MFKLAKSQKGFTLIEILIVIGIIAILATIVIIAINPARQFAQARNTQRTANVTAILNAIGQYIADNQGNRPTDISAAPTVAGTLSDGGLDLCADLMPTYLPSLPTDPSLNTAPVTNCTTYTTGYQVAVDAQGRVTVSAPSAELGATISLTR